MNNEFAISIVGGGVAGAAATLLLAQQGHEVALIDSQPLSAAWPQATLDPRVIALSPGSAAILGSAGVWPLPHVERVTAYQTMQVCSGIGEVSFHADQHGLEALGWIVEIPAIRQALWQRLQAHDNVEVFCPAHIESFENEQNRVRLRLDEHTRLSSRLLVAADGTRSRLRQSAGIGVDQWHYNQHALIAPVRTEQPNPGIAWQRFTEHGPFALLPLPDGASSIVWSQPSGRAQAQVAFDQDQLIDELNAYQDSPMGAITSVGQCHALPLVRRRARQMIHKRLALLGDAARSVHPLAGQGQNLGLADAAALAECLGDAGDQQDIDHSLVRYQRWRRSASEMVGGGIHTINEAARLPLGLGRHLLGVSFLAANRLWPAREVLIERACGFDSDAPARARRAQSA